MLNNHLVILSPCHLITLSLPPIYPHHHPLTFMMAHRHVSAIVIGDRAQPHRNLPDHDESKLYALLQDCNLLCVGTIPFRKNQPIPVSRLRFARKDRFGSCPLGGILKPPMPGEPDRSIAARLLANPFYCRPRCAGLGQPIQKINRSEEDSQCDSKNDRHARCWVSLLASTGS